MAASGSELTISPTAYETIVAAARREAPLEACGLLAGAGAHATSCYVLTNADASPEHFSMVPLEQFAAVRDMRSQGLRLLAIWHSHPGSPARLSAEDLRLAFTPDVLYVVVSLSGAGPPTVCGYQITDGAAARVEVAVVDEQKE